MDRKFFCRFAFLKMIDIVDNFWGGRFHLKLFLFEIVEFALQGTHVIDQFLRHNLGLIFCLEANSEQDSKQEALPVERR